MQADDGFNPSLSLLCASILKLKTFLPVLVRIPSFKYDIPDDRNLCEAIHHKTEHFRRQVKEALGHDQLVEARRNFNHDLYGLLDDLDATASKVVRFDIKEEFPSSRNPWHWAMLMPLRQRYPTYNTIGYNFLSLALGGDLRSFIGSKVAVRPFPRNIGLPLLHCAFGRSLGLSFYHRGYEEVIPAKIEFLELLLEHGADPNEEFRVGQSVWSFVLEVTNEFLKRKPPNANLLLAIWTDLSKKK